MAGALWGAALFWFAEHLPMIDLPQHAGQVVLLRDLVLGQSPWVDLVRMNWLTPYLLGYGLALPLTIVMPAGTALKVLLTLAYLSFVALCVKLGRHFGSDSRLDPLFLLSFFGFAWAWGFVTFLVSAPLVLAFVLHASRYSRNPAPRAALVVFALGMLMLVSHGLAFLFGFGVGALMLTMQQRRRIRVLVPALLPYAALGLACVGFFLIMRATQPEYFPLRSEAESNWNYDWKRVGKVPLYAVSSTDEPLRMVPVALALFAVPLLMGLRMRRDSWQAVLPLVVVGTMMFTVPSYAFNTAFLYERFGIFLLPAWAWAFPAAVDVPASPRSPRRKAAAFLLPVLCCAFVLAQHSIRIWRFGNETKELDLAMGQLQPGARLLWMAFDSDSPSARNRLAYLHYGAWYQADSRGFVDFNFAWFTPQIVRFKLDHVPRVAPGFEWKPETFDWHGHEGWRYRYFFIRGPMPVGLFNQAQCPPVAIFGNSMFTILENRSQVPDAHLPETNTGCGVGHR